MTEIINQIKQALSEATPAPWIARKNEGTYGTGSYALYLGEHDRDGFEHHRLENVNLIINAPTWLSSLITTIESLQEEVKKYKWEDEQFNWLQDQIKTCSSENIELKRQIESQKEEIEVYRSSLQSISDNTKDSGSFIAAQSALNKAKRLQEGEK